MRVLWDAGEATVVEVRAALSDERDRALTNAAGRATLLAPEPAGLGARRAGFAAVYAPAPAQGLAQLTLLGRP